MQATFPEHTASITIAAETSRVWNALTSEDALKKWMLDEELEIKVGEKEGQGFTIAGFLHGVPFKNKGSVLKMEAPRRFSYNHLSSLSNLPDLPCNYSVVDFQIIPREKNTEVKLQLNNFPTESIYKHLVFYWNASLGALKTFVEKS